jgi:hypothetical protein
MEEIHNKLLIAPKINCFESSKIKFGITRNKVGITKIKVGITKIKVGIAKNKVGLTKTMKKDF